MESFLLFSFLVNRSWSSRWSVKEGDTVDEGVIYRHPIRCFLQENVHLILGHRAFRTYR